MALAQSKVCFCSHLSTPACLCPCARKIFACLRKTQVTGTLGFCFCYCYPSRPGKMQKDCHILLSPSSQSRFFPTEYISVCASTYTVSFFLLLRCALRSRSVRIVCLRVSSLSSLAVDTSVPVRQQNNVLPHLFFCISFRCLSLSLRSWLALSLAIIIVPSFCCTCICEWKMCVSMLIPYTLFFSIVCIFPFCSSGLNYFDPLMYGTTLDGICSAASSHPLAKPRSPGRF